MKLFLLAFALITSVAAHATAQTAPIDYSALQTQFTNLERMQINCDYPRLLLQNHYVDAAHIRSDYQPPAPAACVTNRAQYQTLLRSTNLLNHAPTTFPLYSDLVLEQSNSRRTSLDIVSLLTAVNAPSVRTQLAGSSYDIWTVERALRARLGVDSGRRAQTNCAWKTDTNALPEALRNLRGLGFWQNQLINNGYDCTVSLYKAASMQWNQQNNMGSAQEKFAYERRQFVNYSHLAMMGLPLRGLNIVIFPQLAYETPSIVAQLELLGYPQLIRELERLGATVHLIDRTSVADREEQIRQSSVAFANVIREDQRQGIANPRYIAIGRSMGGMVLREVLERRPELRAQVDGAILIGCTPYGAAIAEYKSRADAFDQNFLERNQALETAGVFALQVVNPSFRAVHEGALIRNNIGSMSHRNFDPNEIIRRPLDLKVLNVIQLPDSLGNYFGGYARIRPVDPTFTFMTMYGPTEGSTPLAHAAWDTTRSASVFAGDFNHLGFWGLTPDEGIDYWIATLKTAEHLGFWSMH